MTEQDWLNASHPRAMLGWLLNNGGVTDRKLRLFAAACCRHLGHLFCDKPYRHGADMAERFVDQQARVADLDAIRVVAEQVAWQGGEKGRPGPLWFAGWFTDPFVGARDSSGDPNAPAVLALAATLADPRAGAELCVPWAVALGVDTAVQAAILRDLVHAPHRAVICRAYWRRWNDGTVQKIARALYDERQFAALPILADALEEAGCDNEDILSHCRSAAEHYRGCWVLDLLLHKG